MGHKYELKFIVDETGETVLLSGEFSDNERELLEEFVEHAEGVLNTKFLQSGDWGKLGIKWDENKNMKVTTELPAWDDVIVFLHKFRPLLLQNERTNFYKIHNLLAKNLDHPYFRSLLGKQREVFSGKASQSIMQFRSNDVLINSENILFDWLNSHEYHREKEKKEFIESLHKMIPLDASKVLFLRLLTDKALATYNMTAFIRVVLGKQKQVSVKMRQPLARGK
jgi:hypothetical protein